MYPEHEDGLPVVVGPDGDDVEVLVVVDDVLEVDLPPKLEFGKRTSKQNGAHDVFVEEVVLVGAAFVEVLVAGKH